MDGYATDADPDSLEWPSTGKRIEAARAQSGLTPGEIAERLGITDASYWDLEWFDDEAFKAIPLRVLSVLGETLRVEPRILLLGSEAREPSETVSFADVARRLADHIARAGKSAEQLSDEVGWELQPVLADPEHLWEYDVEALYCITKAVGLDWVAALPRRRPND